MNYYFVLYDDGTHKTHLTKLIESIKKYGSQFRIIIFYKHNISKDFYNKHKHILDLSRGGGYWLWKPYIILETLKHINEGDLVFYLDSKYYFLENFDNLFKPLLENNDIVVWKNKPNEDTYFMKNWCKMDVILKYDMYQKVFNDNILDCWGGCIICKKTIKSLNIISSWLEVCCDYNNITDEPSIHKNDTQFIEHRHDQILLSIILHKNNIPLHFLDKKYIQNVRKPF